MESLLFHADGRAARTAAKRAPSPTSGVAVLPFDNLNADKANAYFADGIQDEIITRLAKIGDLKVISRSSTLPYKTKPENIPEIAKQLAVAHVLEGTVQSWRSGPHEGAVDSLPRRTHISGPSSTTAI